MTGQRHGWGAKRAKFVVQDSRLVLFRGSAGADLDSKFIGGLLVGVLLAGGEGVDIGCGLDEVHRVAQPFDSTSGDSD